MYYDDDEPRPLPDDARFFLGVLWQSGDTRFGEGGPIGDAITVDQILDEVWVDDNTRRFVERVELLSALNDPSPEDGGERRPDFVDENNGQWVDERRLTQADYDVRVTDKRWTAHLVLGQSWGTTFYSTVAKGFTREEFPGGRWVTAVAGAVDGSQSADGIGDENLVPDQVPPIG